MKVLGICNFYHRSAVLAVSDIGCLGNYSTSCGSCTDRSDNDYTKNVLSSLPSSLSCREDELLYRLQTFGNKNITAMPRKHYIEAGNKIGSVRNY